MFVINVLQIHLNFKNDLRNLKKCSVAFLLIHSITMKQQIWACTELWILTIWEISNTSPVCLVHRRPDTIVGWLSIISCCLWIVWLITAIHAWWGALWSLLTLWTGNAFFSCGWHSISAAFSYWYSPLLFWLWDHSLSMNSVANICWSKSNFCSFHRSACSTWLWSSISFIKNL